MDLDLLILKLRDKLNEIGIDQYDHRLAYRDLEDAWDTVQMIADNLGEDITDYASYPTSRVQRCIIRVATYNGYRTYTRLASRQNGTLPESSPVIISYDIVDAQNCLSLLFGVEITPELLPKGVEDANYSPVTSGSMGPSILDYP